MKPSSLLLFSSVVLAGFVAIRCGTGLDTLGGKGGYCTGAGAAAWPSTIEDGATGGTASGNAITTDCSGNVLVVGSTQDKSVDGQPLVDPPGSPDFFLTKYGPDGKRQWTVEDGPGGGTGFAQANAVATDASGNIYVAGQATGSLDGQPAKNTEGGGFFDYFVTCYSSSGVRQWTVQDGHGGGGTNSAAANGIAVDAAANVYVTGVTNNSLDGQPFVNTTVGVNNDFFITQYNFNGARQWTIEDGAPGKTSSANGIAIDSSGNIYVGGQTGGSVDGQTLKGGVSFFLTKYDASKALQWTVENGGAGAADSATGQSIALDQSGHVYIGGTMSGTFNGQSFHDVPSGSDVYLAQYSTSGAFQWVTQDGPGSSANLQGWSLAADSLGNIYLGGLTDTAMHGQTLHDIGNSDLFISRYASDGSRVWTIEDGPGGVTNANAQIYGLAVDSTGNLFATGVATGDSPGPTAGLDGVAAFGISDSFATQYSSSGARN